ncbi:hypothetical protein FRB90_003369, partial [Tulasnella sp. 427]
MSNPFTTFLERHETFYFPDGNICLVAHGVVFRLLRSLLAGESEVFRDLFVVGSDGQQDMYDGVPLITVDDDPDDLARIFGLLWKPLITKSDFDVICSSIRISTKYLMDNTLKWAVEELDKMIPHGKQDFATSQTFYMHYPERAAEVITLARKCNLPKYLPFAFYFLATEPTGSVAPIRGPNALTAEDVRRIHAGKASLQNWWWEFALRSYDFGLNVARPEGCPESSASPPARGHYKASQSSRGPLRLPRHETKRTRTAKFSASRESALQKRQTASVPSKIVRNGQDPIRQLYASGARQETTASSQTSPGQQSSEVTTGDPNDSQSGDDIRAQYESYHNMQQNGGTNDGEDITYHTAGDGSAATPGGTATAEPEPATAAEPPSDTPIANGSSPSPTSRPPSHASPTAATANPAFQVPNKPDSQGPPLRAAAPTPTPTPAAVVEVMADQSSPGERPTTMTHPTPSEPITAPSLATLSPVIPVSQLPAPILPHSTSHSSGALDPTETGLFDGDPSSDSGGGGNGSATAIGIAAALLSVAFIIVVVYLRRRVVAAKARADRERFEELQRDFLATKESSLFGGPDRGSTSLDSLNDRKMTTGPSWDDGFMGYLPPPSPVPAATGQQQRNPGAPRRISMRGSGWMVIGEKSPVLGTEAITTEGNIPTPPNVHFKDGRAPRQGFEPDLQSTSSVSTVEEAVIATASRVSAASVYTTQSTRKPPTAYNSISPYDQTHLNPEFSVPVPKVPVPQSVTDQHQDRHKPTTQVNVSRSSGAPPNTAIGRGILKDRNGRNGDGNNKENLPALPMAPLRIQKKSNAIAAPTPTKPPHMSIISSYPDDEDDTADPFEHDRPSGQPQARRYHYQKRQSLFHSRTSSVGFNPSQSMGELMLTPYGDDAGVSDVEDSPVIGVVDKTGAGK